ncbi:unnamed protein product [Amoebophrya sp. A120]|nr:unnamed protein product [Amoebophrya sp. A120]|eukprot:GSA120T00013588001.1
MLSHAASADVLCGEPPAALQGHAHSPQRLSSASTYSARSCVVAFPTSSGFSSPPGSSSQRLDQHTETACEKKSHSAPGMVTQVDQDARRRTSFANATVMSHSCEAARPREEPAGAMQLELPQMNDDIFSCTGKIHCNSNSRSSISCTRRDLSSREETGSCWRRNVATSARSWSSSTLVEEAPLVCSSLVRCTTFRGVGRPGQEGGAASVPNHQSREHVGHEVLEPSRQQQRKMQQATSQLQDLEHVVGKRIKSATGSPVVSTTVKTARPSSCSDSRSLFKSTMWSRLEGPLKRLFLPVRKYNNLIRQKNEAKETSRSRTQGASTVSASSMQDKEKTKSTRKNSFSTGATTAAKTTATMFFFLASSIIIPEASASALLSSLNLDDCQCAVEDGRCPNGYSCHCEKPKDILGDPYDCATDTKCYNPVCPAGYWKCCFDCEYNSCAFQDGFYIQSPSFQQASFLRPFWLEEAIVTHVTDPSADSSGGSSSANSDTGSAVYSSDRIGPAANNGAASALSGITNVQRADAGTPLTPVVKENIKPPIVSGTDYHGAINGMHGGRELNLMNTELTLSSRGRMECLPCRKGDYCTGCDNFAKCPEEERRDALRGYARYSVPRLSNSKSVFARECARCPDGWEPDLWLRRCVREFRNECDMELLHLCMDRCYYYDECERHQCLVNCAREDENPRCREAMLETCEELNSLTREMVITDPSLLPASATTVTTSTTGINEDSGLSVLAAMEVDYQCNLKCGRNTASGLKLSSTVALVAILMLTVGAGGGGIFV